MKIYIDICETKKQADDIEADRKTGDKMTLVCRLPKDEGSEKITVTDHTSDFDKRFYGKFVLVFTDP